MRHVSRIYGILICLILCLCGISLHASDAKVEITTYHGNFSNPYETIDDSYLVKGQTTLYYRLPALQRNDLTIYSLFSGNSTDWPIYDYPYHHDGASASNIVFVPTKEQPYLVIYYAVVICLGYGLHDPLYDSIAVFDNHNRPIGCSYSFVSNDDWTDLNASQGFFLKQSPYNNMLYDGYRPWKTMLMDLSQYIGQPVTIKIIASCCNNYNCHSWVYFAMDAFGTQPTWTNDCQNSILRAPALMPSYEWHKDSPSGPVIGTDSTLSVPPKEAGAYYCTVGSDDCGANTLRLGEVATAISDFSWVSDCSGLVTFTNNSYINYVDSFGLPHRVQPDSIWWDYGLGRTSADFQGKTLYYPEGTHTILLRVGAKNVPCDSTITKEIIVRHRHSGNEKITVCPSELPYPWNGLSLEAPGTYMATIALPGGCDSVATVDFQVRSVSDCSTPGEWGDHPLNPYIDCDTAYTHTYANIKEQELPTFQWNGILMNRIPHNNHQDTTLVAPLMKADQSCDSIATLHLHVLFPCELPTETKPVRWKK